MVQPLRVILAEPRGFCAGVVRAIDIVERALALADGPVYVRHQIVHNGHVVSALEAKGAVFVDEVDQIPQGALTVFSAHGVAPAVEAAAAARGLDVIDATCPLVAKVHHEGRRYSDLGYDVILIGHAGHAEVEGTRGRIPGPLHVVGSVEEAETVAVGDPRRVAYVTQTTLGLIDTRDIIAVLQRRFPAIVGPDTRDICYATQNRQSAVMELAGRVQLLLVLGSANSSNATRLCELGRSHGIASHLIDDAGEIDEAWLDGVETVGLTAGASTPDHLVRDSVLRLRAVRPVVVETLPGRAETVRFRLPERLIPIRPRPAEEGRTGTC